MISYTHSISLNMKKNTGKMVAKEENEEGKEMDSELPIFDIAISP